MLRTDAAKEEPIRRWPVWFARLANRVIGWSSEACAGGCGYPLTGRFSYELEVVGKTRVVMGICSLGGRCEREVQRDPRDEDGASYADFRPGIITNIAKHPDTDVVRLTFSFP